MEGMAGGRKEGREDGREEGGRDGGREGGRERERERKRMEGKEWKDRKEGKTRGLEKRVNQKKEKSER